MDLSEHVKPRVETTSSASQCNILTSAMSCDFQCQAEKADIDVCSDIPVKVSPSIDFQCQVGASHSDFQCQFNDNVSA